jgi:hypothetical protein
VANTYDTIREKLQAAMHMPETRARQLLMDPKTPAPIVYVAARAFYGPGLNAYEPDTLWATLDIPELNRDKLMAAITLQVFPSFFWDLRVFGNTCLAFSGYGAPVELVPRPTAEQLVAGVCEAQMLYWIDGEHDFEFDDEVAAYVAACLANEGLTYAPPILDFAQEPLLKLLSPEGRKLAAEMKKMAGEEHPKADPESALGVQLARYEQMGAYLTACSVALVPYLR